MQSIACSRPGESGAEKDAAKLHIIWSGTFQEQSFWPLEKQEDSAIDTFKAEWEKRIELENVGVKMIGDTPEAVSIIVVTNALARLPKEWHDYLMRTFPEDRVVTAREHPDPFALSWSTEFQKSLRLPPPEDLPPL